jgi:t-SNARE complex subunit (syntaxin)
MREIEVRWQAEDGYCGGGRPQTTVIDIEDFSSDMTDEEVMDVIYERVEEDFRQTVSPGVDDIDSAVIEIRAALEAKKNDD